MRSVEATYYLIKEKSPGHITAQGVPLNLATLAGDACHQVVSLRRKVDSGLQKSISQPMEVLIQADDVGNDDVVGLCDHLVIEVQDVDPELLCHGPLALDGLQVVHWVCQRLGHDDLIDRAQAVREVALLLRREQLMELQPLAPETVGAVVQSVHPPG